MLDPLSPLDFLMLPVYLAILYLIGLQIASRNRRNPLYGLYYVRGLNYKFLGSVSFAFIYVFYYKGGDTISFWYTVQPLFKLFFTNPSQYLGFVLSTSSPYPADCIWDAASHGVIYMLRGTPTVTTIRIAGILDLFCMNSYFALCLLFAFISYQFQWRMFVLLTSVYPKLHKQLAVAFLMIPSVLFWGSGLWEKIALCLAVLCCFFTPIITW